MDTKKLRQKILDLAIHGKLVPQDPNDEPASVLLERIRAEKEKLIKEGKIKAPKKSKTAGDTSHYPKDVPFEVPEGWVWTTLGSVAIDMADGPFGSNLKREHYTSRKEARIIQLSNIGENGWKEDNTKYTSLNHANEISRSIVNPGDLVIAKMMPAGRAIICPDHEKMFVLSSDAVKYVPSHFVYNRYLLFCINSPIVLSQIQAEVHGVTRARTSIEKLRHYRIPLPPYREQKRIVEQIEFWLATINLLDEGKDQLEVLVSQCKECILALAINGKLTPQDASDEPAIAVLKRINPAFKPSDNLHYGDRLPKGWTCGLFGELNQHRNKSEDPLSSPDEEYELYSVPTYETGKPEFLHGKDIGSTKQVVEKGDVLLCKINPHLNRAWVVSHYRPELKCIASSEWIIFNNGAILPEYARLFFMSPQFKELMLSNVSGVGGSLMRARASAVNNYPIWIPPINEQVRIVQAVQQLNATIESIASILE